MGIILGDSDEMIKGPMPMHIFKYISINPLIILFLKHYGVMSTLYKYITPGFKIIVVFFNV